MENLTKSSLSIECSPKTFQRLQTDEQYRNEVTQQAILNQGPDFVAIENIYISQSETCGETTVPDADGEDAANESTHAIATNNTTEQIVCDDDDTNIIQESEFIPSNEAGNSKIWLEAPTKLLLSLYKSMQPKVGKSIDLKNKTKMWRTITAELEASGYEFTETQVQSRFRTLERQYKKTKLHNSKTGRNRITCPLYSELSEVFSQRRGLHPDYVLDNESASGTSRSELMQDDSGSGNDNNESQGDSAGTLFDDENPGPSTSAHKRLKRRELSHNEKIFKKVEAMHRDRSEYQKKVIQFLEEKKEREKARDERSERKLALLQKIEESLRR